MQILSLNFRICKFTGIWRPRKWSSCYAKLLYSAFTVFSVFQLYFMMITQLMDLVLVVDNMDDFINNSLMLVSVIVVSCKATAVALRQRSITNLTEMLLNDSCKPRDEDELAIQAKFDEFIRSCTVKYIFMTTISMTSIVLRSVLDIMHGHLPNKVWVPYDLNKFPLFLITSINQIIVVIVGTYINVGSETLIFGFILQTCAQLDILKCRLNKSVIKQAAGYRDDRPFSLSNKGQSIISEHICHHNNIYTYAKTVNSIFNEVLFVQFFGSILVLCTCVYYMSMHITESKVMGIVVYTACMFVQIFIFCWSGNEVIIKSVNLTDAVYQVDWCSLSTSNRKDLLMIMRRSTMPIKFTSSFLITLSLQSYGNILKTSYSAFNVLQ